VGTPQFEVSMDKAEQFKQIRRMNELFRPIERQILMTDDENDLTLLSTVMLTTAKRIFIDRFGEESARTLMKTIIER